MNNVILTHLCSFILTLFLFPLGKAGQSEEPTVYALLFYSPSCPHCHKVITEDLPPLIEKFGDQVLETFTFAKGATKEEKQSIKKTKDAIAGLVGTEVTGRNSPELPEAYYYTPAGSGKPTGIKRSGGWAK